MLHLASGASDGVAPESLGLRRRPTRAQTSDSVALTAPPASPEARRCGSPCSCCSCQLAAMACAVRAPATTGSPVAGAACGPGPSWISAGAPRDAARDPLSALLRGRLHSGRGASARGEPRPRRRADHDQRSERRPSEYSLSGPVDASPTSQPPRPGEQRAAAHRRRARAARDAHDRSSAAQRPPSKLLSLRRAERRRPSRDWPVDRSPSARQRGAESQALQSCVASALRSAGSSSPTAARRLRGCAAAPCVPRPSGAREHRAWAGRQPRYRRMRSASALDRRDGPAVPVLL